jgi:hypothetical protein
VAAGGHVAASREWRSRYGSPDDEGERLVAQALQSLARDAREGTLGRVRLPDVGGSAVT